MLSLPVLDTHQPPIRVMALHAVRYNPPFPEGKKQGREAIDMPM